MDLRALWFSLACSGLSLAQTQLVVPASHAVQEGSSSSNVPFGRGSPTRAQLIYDGSLFAGASTITEVAFRLDGDATAASKVVDCEIQMGYLAGALVNMSADFATNRAGTLASVLPRQLLTLPAQTTVATPSPFLPAIALAQPFAYDPALGALLIEVIVYSQPPAAYTLDVTYVCDSPEVLIGPTGCPQSSNLPLRLESATTQVMWGRPWVGRVLDAAPGTMTLMAFGTMDSGNWQGWNLPFDLVGLGAAGCYLSIDVAVLLLQPAATDGSASFTLNMPNNPALVGVWLRFQAGAIDAAANALGIVTSQAKKVQVCGFEPVGRVWASGLSATAGSREIGIAPVLLLTMQ